MLLPSLVASAVEKKIGQFKKAVAKKGNGQAWV